MIITEFQLSRLQIPLITPFKTALRTVHSIDDIVVMIHCDTGHIGYGEAPPTAAITGETHGSIIESINKVIKPALIGKSLMLFNECIEIIQTALIGNSSAKAAVEMALYDLYAQFYQTPLYQYLGGGTPHLTTDMTISVNSVEKMVTDSLNAIQLGFTTLKIKVGNNRSLDIQRVKAIHQAIQNKALLRLDVNQGWNLKEALYAIKYLEGEGIPLELVEQPLRADDLHGMKYLTQHVLSPIMADESAFSPKEVIEIIKSHSADIINIKLMKTGGLSNAIKIADIAALYHVECMIGCMLESSISVGAAAHLAVAKTNSIKKIDLDGPSLCQYNPVVGGVQFEGAKIVLSAAPGLGIQKIKELKPIVL
jgi:o-succinylbenzoate synthase